MNRKQGRAVALTVIMVLSVAVTGLAFVGGAAASDIDRHASDGGTVDPGAENVEVLDFNLTSEDQVLDSDRANTGNDGDVEPGDDLESLDPGQYSYVDDNGNQEYEPDETLIYDGNGIPGEPDNDEFDSQSEIIRYTDGAFRPYQFIHQNDGEDRYFIDADNDGDYDGDDPDTSAIENEAILTTGDDEDIDDETNPLTTGQADLTAFTDGSLSGDVYIYDADNEEKGNEYEPAQDDAIFINNGGGPDYDDGTDTIIVGDKEDLAGSASANIYSVNGNQLGDKLFFLDFNGDGDYNANTGGPAGAGGEPVAQLTEDANIGSTSTGDALPNTAEFLDAGDDIGNNYYDQYDTDTQVFEEGGEPDGNNGNDDAGLQTMASTDTLFLDDGQSNSGVGQYAGEDGEGEDVVENDLEASNVLVDGALNNFKGENIGFNADGDGTSQEDNDAVIRGQDPADGSVGGASGDYDTGLDLYTEPDGDNYEELVLVNEVDDDVNEGSDADAPGPDDGDDDDDPDDQVKYGDAMVDLTVTNTGTAIDNEDIAGATLFRESDGNSELSSGDTLVSGSTFQQNDLISGAPGQYVFSNVNQLFGNGTTGDSQEFYVGVNVQDNADEGDTLQFAIPKFRDGQTRNAFNSQLFTGSSFTASDTGLFLESAESFSTGPVTDSNGDVYRQDYYQSSGQIGGPISGGTTGPGPIVTEQTATIGVEGDDGDNGDETNSLRIVGTGDRTFYSFRASSDVSGTSITGEDNIEGSTVTGAVGPGSDSFEFDGELENLYVPTGASVFLNGNQINPDNYESELSFDGNGDRTSYTFAVTNGEITGTQSLSGEDDVSDTSASGAVGGGSDGYTFTGVIKGLDTDGSADVVLNGQDVDPSKFYNTIRFDGQGTRASYDFTVSGEIKGTSGVTGEDSVNGDTVSGAITGGSDIYVYSGTLEELNTNGNVDVTQTSGEASDD